MELFSPEREFNLYLEFPSERYHSLCFIPKVDVLGILEAGMYGQFSVSDRIEFTRTYTINKNSAYSFGFLCDVGTPNPTMNIEGSVGGYIEDKESTSGYLRCEQDVIAYPFDGDPDLYQLEILSYWDREHLPNQESFGTEYSLRYNPEQNAGVGYDCVYRIIVKEFIVESETGTEIIERKECFLVVDNSYFQYDTVTGIFSERFSRSEIDPNSPELPDDINEVVSTLMNMIAFIFANSDTIGMFMDHKKIETLLDQQRTSLLTARN